MLGSGDQRDTARIRLVMIETMPLINAIIMLMIPDTSATTMPILSLHLVGRPRFHAASSGSHRIHGLTCRPAWLAPARRQVGQAGRTVTLFPGTLMCDGETSSV